MGRPLVARLYVTITYFRALLAHLPPLLSTQLFQGSGEENVLLFVKHLADGGGQRGKNFVELGAKGLWSLGPKTKGRRISAGAIAQQGIERLPPGADVVVDGPHHSRRPAEAMFFQEGKEDVLLAQVVFSVFAQFPQVLPCPLQALRIRRGLWSLGPVLVVQDKCPKTRGLECHQRIFQGIQHARGSPVFG